MDPHDGCVTLHGPAADEPAPAFTEVGIEELRQRLAEEAAPNPVA